MKPESITIYDFYKLIFCLVQPLFALEAGALPCERLLWPTRNQAAYVEKQQKSVIHLYNKMLSYAEKEKDIKNKRAVILRAQKRWQKTIASALQKFSAKPLFNGERFLGFDLSRERITAINPLLTRWLPQDYRILYQPFVSIFNQRPDEVVVREQNLFVPLWFPFFPYDYSNAMNIFRAAVRIRLQMHRAQNSSQEFSAVFFLKGELKDTLAPFFDGNASRIDIEEIIVTFAASAFGLDCMAITEKEQPFASSIKELEKAKRMLNGYLWRLYPFLKNHKQDSEWRRLEELQYSVVSRRSRMPPPRNEIWAWLESIGLDTQMLRPWPHDCAKF